ncbi:porphobilinogen synthase [Flavobacteriaceae bacterium]|jgi:porphobilinogen synthase|nr:porphobilinogen synthase [Flavobacteriaceae bacterium]|tara:strand:+ start:13872 stop:14846 length:975 start_codon:yes stop_codon:yes gene_type:complete
MYPQNRNRRLRTKTALRNLVRESSISPHDFIAPLFVVEGTSVKEEIVSMPGYYRLSLDYIKKEVKQLYSMGVQAVLLFVKVSDSLKDNLGTEALNKEGLMQRAIKEIKNNIPEIVIMTDIALDPYSKYGHDGVVKNKQILNDETNLILSEMALSHSICGADIVAPSDMMDGRVLAIRNALEKNGHVNTGIMSYGAKYASSFYGPFRDALDSNPGFGDKKTYQMDFHNRKEALNEINADINEGADIIMIKPGLSYLDIVREVKNSINIPLAVYQVSGEYSMLKAAAKLEWINHDEVMMEQLISIKRAGANMIASYFAKDVIKLIS